MNPDPSTELDVFPPKIMYNNSPRTKLGRKATPANMMPRNNPMPVTSNNDR